MNIPTFTLIILCFAIKSCASPTLLLRSEESYAIFHPFIPCPSGILSFQFLSHNSDGLLIYSEDNSTGRFLSITSLPNYRIKVELELRLPQYRTTREHVTLLIEYDKIRRDRITSMNHVSPEGHWHQFNMSLRSTNNDNVLNLLTIFIDNHHIKRHMIPGIIYHNEYDQGSFIRTYFGQPMYVGQLPPVLRIDATQRSLFSAAMQTSFNGLIKNMYLGNCVTLSCTQNNFPLYLSKGASFTSGNPTSFETGSQCSSFQSVIDKQTSYLMARSKFSETSEWCTASESHGVINLEERSYAIFHLPFTRDANGFSLQFRTRDDDQMLLNIILSKEMHSTNSDGDIEAVIFVYISNGTLTTAMKPVVRNRIPNIQAMNIERQIDCLSDYRTCSDTQWHEVKYFMDENTVHIGVDQQPPIKQSLPYATTNLSLRTIHLGNFVPEISKHLSHTIGSIFPSRSFRGCLRNMVYQMQNQFSSLHSLKRKQLSEKIIQQECDLELLETKIRSRSTPMSDQYVSFAKPGGFLRTRGWRTVSDAELSFTLRTTEPDGLLLYSTSFNEFEFNFSHKSHIFPAISGPGRSGFDIIALELRNGFLVACINTGSGTLQLGVPLSKTNLAMNKHQLNDGKLHRILLHFMRGDLLIHIDGEFYASHKADSASYQYLNLNGIFYLGGMPNTIRHISSMISPEVWSARLNKDFIGCLGEFKVNNRSWDLELQLRACWADGYVHKGCFDSAQFNWCAKERCANGGVCKPGWNRYICDCSTTNFDGDRCTRNPSIFSFNGHQWLRIQVSPFPVQSTVEKLLIRFRTKQTYGLLLTTRIHSAAASDCLEILLVGGHLVVIYDFGVRKKRFENKINVADDLWHTLQVYRQGRFLRVIVDNSSQTYDTPDYSQFLAYKHILLGRSEILADQNTIDSFPRQHLNQSFVNSDMNVFIGHVMKFQLNGVDYLHVAKNLVNTPDYVLWKDQLEISATEGTKEPLLEFPLSFTSTNSFVSFRLPKPLADFKFAFWFKTNKHTGILLLLTLDNFTAVGLEFVNGHLQLVYSAGINHHEQADNLPLADSKWHLLEVFGKYVLDQLKFSVRFDNTSLFASLPADYVNRQNKLHVGGLADSTRNPTSWSQLFNSDESFHGCITLPKFAVVERNDNYVKTTRGQTKVITGKYRVVSLLSAKKEHNDWQNIHPGCSIQSGDLQRRQDAHCTPRICQYDGRCVQQLGDTRCDCSMTSFSGKYCTEIASAVYLEKDSQLSFELTIPQNTTRDQLAFGIQIVEPGVFPLLRLKGHNRNSDFLEVSIAPFKNRHVIVIRYNMGGGLFTLIGSEVDVADGDYHVVQFVRDGMHSMLRIDLYHEHTLLAKARKGTHFNDIKFIQVGSPPGTFHTDKPVKSTPKFEAYLAAPNFNGIDLLQLARGMVIPGIFIAEQQNIKFHNVFKARLGRLDMSTMLGPETSKHRFANDMQSNDKHVMNEDDRMAEPLIVPKLDCLDPTAQIDIKTCRPVDEHGIIKPFIEVAEHRGRETIDPAIWNADKPPQQPTQPNDLDSSSSSINHFSDNQKNGQFGTEKKSNGHNPIWSGPYLKEPEFKKHPLSSTTLPEGIPIRPPDINLPTNNFPHDYPVGLTVGGGGVGGKHFVFNIGLIASVSIAGVCVLIVLTCIIYRCTRRDEGSYNIVESLAYTDDTPIQLQTIGDPREGMKKSIHSATTTISNDRPAASQNLFNTPVFLVATEPNLLVTLSDSYNLATATAPGTSSDINQQKQVTRLETMDRPASESLVNTDDSQKRKSQLIKISDKMEDPNDDILKQQRQHKTRNARTGSKEWFV